MNISDINWLAVAVSSIVYFMVSGIWFGPKTFYPAWQKAMGRNPDDINGSTLPMAALFGTTFVATVAQVFTVAVVVELAIKAEAGFGLLQASQPVSWFRSVWLPSHRFHTDCLLTKRHSPFG